MSKGLLVVSFGTSVAETRKKTIEAIEAELAAAFPERKAYRAWTSSIIRRKLRSSGELNVDSVEEAMERMLSDGITDLLVQPTHILPGGEYGKVVSAVNTAAGGRFARLRLGKPLMTSDEDVQAVAAIIEQEFSFVPSDEMLALMGHGSAETETNYYLLLAEAFRKAGYPNFIVGTVEEEPGFEPVLAAARQQKPKLIRLLPFMVVAGDHAINDMAGDEEDSWASMLRKEGFRVECILKGMGEFGSIRAMMAEKAKQADAD
jgi:sirohydrochlorin cobaltochelatase